MSANKHKKNRVIKILSPFFSITIGNVINKPNHAFLEKVKNAAKPTERKKPNETIFLKI